VPDDLRLGALARRASGHHIDALRAQQERQAFAHDGVRVSDHQRDRARG